MGWRPIVSGCEGAVVASGLIFDQSQGVVTAHQIYISNIQGGFTLLIYAGVVLLATLIVFKRRDIT